MREDSLSKRRAELEKRTAQLSDAQRAKLTERLGNQAVSPSTAALSKPFIALRTELEQQIATIWGRELSRDQISVLAQRTEQDGRIRLEAAIVVTWIALLNTVRSEAARIFATFASVRCNALFGGVRPTHSSSF